MKRAGKYLLLLLAVRRCVKWKGLVRSVSGWVKWMRSHEVKGGARVDALNKAFSDR